MPFRLLACLLLSFCITSLCHANLGDTLAKCQERYGSPVPGKDSADPSGVGDAMLLFRKDGYDIKVILVRGYVGGEAFAKTNGTEFADKDKEALLDGEARGWAWAKNTAAAGENWLRTDGAVASYVSAQHTMVLETQPYLTAVKQAGHP